MSLNFSHRPAITETGHVVEPMVVIKVFFLLFYKLYVFLKQWNCKLVVLKIFTEPFLSFTQLRFDSLFFHKWNQAWRVFLQHKCWLWYCNVTSLVCCRCGLGRRTYGRRRGGHCRRGTPWSRANCPPRAAGSSPPSPSTTWWSLTSCPPTTARPGIPLARAPWSSRWRRQVCCCHLCSYYCCAHTKHELLSVTKFQGTFY